VPGGLKRRHSAPYLTNSEPLDGEIGPWKGSKFWVLDNETSEDSEDDGFKEEDRVHEEEDYRSEKEFIRDATQVGFSVDDLLRAESLLTENFNSPKFASVDRGAGHVRHPRPLASRITEAVADLRFLRTEKSWKGPLPKPRSLQLRQVGDILIKDLRKFNSPRTAKSLKDLCLEKNIGFSSSKKERKEGQTGSASVRGRSLDCPVGFGWGRFAAGTLVKIGSHPAFRPTQGLNCLFNARGVPRSLAVKGRNLSTSTRARRVQAYPNQYFPSKRELVSGSRVEWETEGKKMAGNFGARDRGGWGNAGAYGPYRRDRGAVGAGRSWGGRDGWAWRGGAPRGDFRGARGGRLGGFGRGRDGQSSLPLSGGGRGGAGEQASGDGCGRKIGNKHRCRKRITE
jgi:hypothetical protein